MIGLGASMNPTTDINQTREALISRVDEQLAHVNEQIRSADEQLARLSSRKSEAPRGYHSPGRPRGRPWLRGIVGLLIAAYIVAAALVSQSPFGNAVAESAPLNSLTSARRNASTRAVSARSMTCFDSRSRFLAVSPVI